MAMMIIHHRVQNYEAWRPVYDAHEPARNAAGLTNGRVFRSTDEPDDVVILFDMADRGKAEALLSTEDMKTTMQRAGVQGRPDIRFME
jgi:hypothetical protein